MPNLASSLYKNFWTKDFHLTPAQISQTKKYFILYWPGNLVFRKLLQSPRIIKDSIPYQPIFLDGLTQDYLSFHPETLVRLSFRLPKLAKTGIVLISSIPEKKVVSS